MAQSNQAPQYRATIHDTPRIFDPKYFYFDSLSKFNPKLYNDARTYGLQGIVSDIVTSSKKDQANSIKALHNLIQRMHDLEYENQKKYLYDKFDKAFVDKMIKAKLYNQLFTLGSKQSVDKIQSRLDHTRTSIKNYRDRTNLNRRINNFRKASKDQYIAQNPAAGIAGSVAQSQMLDTIRQAQNARFKLAYDKLDQEQGLILQSGVGLRQSTVLYGNTGGKKLQTASDQFAQTAQEIKKHYGVDITDLIKKNPQLTHGIEAAIAILFTTRAEVIRKRIDAATWQAKDTEQKLRLLAIEDEKLQNIIKTIKNVVDSSGKKDIEQIEDQQYLIKLFSQFQTDIEKDSNDAKYLVVGKSGETLQQIFDLLDVFCRDQHITKKQLQNKEGINKIAGQLNKILAIIEDNKDNRKRLIQLYIQRQKYLKKQKSKLDKAESIQPNSSNYQDYIKGLRKDGLLIDVDMTTSFHKTVYLERIIKELTVQLMQKGGKFSDNIQLGRINTVTGSVGISMAKADKKTQNAKTNSQLVIQRAVFKKSQASLENTLKSMKKGHDNYVKNADALRQKLAAIEDFFQRIDDAFKKTIPVKIQPLQLSFTNTKDYKTAGAGGFQGFHGGTYTVPQYLELLSEFANHAQLNGINTTGMQFAIRNAAKGGIFNRQLTRFENFLSIIASSLMFADTLILAEEAVKEQESQTLSTKSTNLINVFMLNGHAVPLSMMYKQLLNSLTKGLGSQNFNGQGYGARAKIRKLNNKLPQQNQEMLAANKPWPQRWDIIAALSNESNKSTRIQIMFMKNFVQYIENLYTFASAF